MDSFRNIRDDGILDVANAAERLVLLPSVGFVVLQLDTMGLWGWNGSSWVALGSGGGGGTPGGPNRAVQYNNAGVFDGTSNLVYDGTTLKTNSINITSAPANAIIYQDASQIATGDTLATRLQNNTLDTAIGSYFQGSGADLTQTDVFLTDNAQSTSVVTLVFNGTDNCATVVTAWNTANPTNTVTQIGGNGTDVLSAQTITLSSGKASFNSGNSTIPLFAAPVSGVLFNVVDYNNVLGFFGTGDYTNLTGLPGTSNVFAVVDAGFAKNSVMFQSLGATSIFAQNGSNGVGININANQFKGGFNAGNNSFNVDGAAFCSWSDGTHNFQLPAGVAPTTGQVLGVSFISGSDYFLSFQNAGSGTVPTGSTEFQYLKWDTGTSLPVWNNLYAQTDDTGANLHTIYGYKALGITNTNVNPLGSYANTALGAYTLSNLAGTQDNRNTALGFSAGSQIPQSTRSTYVGYQVYGNGAVTSIDGSYFGADVIISNGTGNSYFGVQGQISGTQNSSFGSYNVLNGSKNGVFGTNITLANVTTANYNLLLGANLTTGSNNFLAGFGGPGNITSGNSNLGILGCNNVTTGNNNVGLGSGSLQTVTTGSNNTGIAGGDVLTGITFQSIAIGESSFAGTNGLAIGTGAVAQDYSIALGQNSVTTGVSQFVAGSNNQAMTDVWFGQGQNGQGAWTLHGSEPLLNSNGSGGDLNIIAGRGTGLQSGGTLNLGSGYTGGVSGTTPNTPFYGIRLSTAQNQLSLGDPYNAIPGILFVTATPTMVIDYSASTLSVVNLNGVDVWGSFDLVNNRVAIGDVSSTHNASVISVDDPAQTANLDVLRLNFAPSYGASPTATMDNSSGKFVRYNNEGVQGSGVVSIVGENSIIGQTTDFTSTTIYTPIADGLFEVGSYAECTTAATSGNYQLIVRWTDNVGAEAQNLGSLNVGTTGFIANPTTTIFAKSGQPIAIQATGVGVVGTATYNAYFYVKRIV